jgi:hypothetical protein
MPGSMVSYQAEMLAKFMGEIGEDTSLQAARLRLRLVMFSTRRPLRFYSSKFTVIITCR